MVRMPLEKKKNEKMSSSEIEKLIDKGAPVKSDIQEEKRKWVYINLRIPSKLLRKIDDEVDQLPGISRTGWILQAIDKELKK